MAVPTGFLSRVASLFGRRGYEAAEIAPRFRETDSRWREWQTIGGSAVPASLAMRSEHQYRNYGYWKNACDSWVDALAGAGFGIIPKNAALSTAWQAYAANAVWGGGTLDGLLINLVRAMIVSGEGLAVEQRDGRLHQLPRSAIAGDYSATLAEGREVREGIELNDGEEVAIWIRRDQDTDLERIERPFYHRVWRQDFPDQVRGVPWGASVLITADTLDDTERAILKGVQTSALLSVLMVNQNDMGAAFPFEGETHGSVMESGLEPGALKIVPGGYTPHIVAPQHSQQAGDFLKHELRRIAAGFGLPVHKVSGDLSDANYSSLRAGQLSLNTRAEAIQYSIVVAQLLLPVWQRFVVRQYLVGEAASMEESAEFIAPRPGAVDPQKDTAATGEMLDRGLISRRRAVAELGWDVATIDKESSEDRSREKALGLNFSEKNNA
jgi:lambda family phage portal protein